MEKQEFLTFAKKLIECCDWFYLSTFNKELDSAETRAMANVRSSAMFPENNELFAENDLSNYIITALSSGKVAQLKENKTCSIYYFCPKMRQALTLFGDSKMIYDDEIKKSIWRKEWQNYFEQGEEDPEYAVIKFTPKLAKYMPDHKHIYSIDL